MEDRALQPPNELLQAPTAVTEAPSPPQAPSDGDAPAPSSSDDESEEGEFEFPFVSRDSSAGTAAPADELFSNGRIRPFYPVLGRGGGGGVLGHDDSAAWLAPAAAAPRVRGQLGRLFLEESCALNASISSTASTASSSSSVATDDDRSGGLEGAPPESYCLWTHGQGSSSWSSPRPPRKSSSTGSMARWRRFSELVVGRSHSDGKEKFIFFPAPHQPPKEAASHHDKPMPKPKAKPSPASGVVRKAPAEVDTVAAAHRIAYGGAPGGTPRRTFLPYREELVGFFANVNGISRSHQHPF